MTITIYGRPGSRARRPLWVARELGLDIQNIEPAPGETRQPAYLAINPNGKVPALVDNGFALFESLAESMYLAKKYGTGRLYPDSVELEALVWQWTLWGLNELERGITVCLFERVIKPEVDRDPADADRAEAELQIPLQVLDAALSDRLWLLGAEFSVADINLASIAAIARPAKVSLESHVRVSNWLDRATARPGYNGDLLQP